jgi:hypothetical protein
LRGKFRELAGTVLAPDGIHEVEETVDRCAEWPNIGELISRFRRHTHP